MLAKKVDAKQLPKEKEAEFVTGSFGNIPQGESTVLFL